MEKLSFREAWSRGFLLIIFVFVGFVMTILDFAYPPLREEGKHWRKGIYRTEVGLVNVEQEAQP